MPVRSLYRRGDRTLILDLTPRAMRKALQDEKGLLWVDLSVAPEEEWRPILIDLFHFHPLAIEDTVQDVNTPKLDNYGDYLYLVAHGVAPVAGEEMFRTRELDCFLGGNYLVTFHREPSISVDAMWERAQRDERLLAQGADLLLYEILDAQVDRYMPVLDALDEAIDRIEDEIFSVPTVATLDRLFTIKRDTLHLRRIISPQRETINRLSREEHPAIQPKARLYFRDVYDHLVRVVDINESLRDLTTGALEIYLSVVSNRLNQVMKILTVFSTIFLPLTLLASIYGMNFQLIPGSQLPYGFAALVGLMILTGAGMAFYFKRRGWW